MPGTSLRPVVYAHRGACTRAPENTLAAFELAAGLGAPAIELDVRLTADQQVVVLHDSTVDRTTDGHGVVTKMTLAEVKALDAGSYFSPEFKNEKIPALAEVFERLGRRVVINIELANYTTPGDGLGPCVAGLIHAYGLEQRVVFSSFQPYNLILARRIIPEVPLGLLTFAGRLWGFLRSFAGDLLPHEALNPHFSDVNEALIRRQHSRGRQVNAWVVNRPEDVRRLAGLGVDGLITDDPAMALAALDHRQAA